MSQVAATILRRIVTPGAVCFALAGCVASQTQALANGAQGRVVSCNGTAGSMADCFAKADQVCPAGYEIIGATGESQPVLVETSRALIAGHVAVHSLTVHSLTVQCH
jgi:hypothetical protein